MIQVEHLSKAYANTLAVDDLSFEVQAGEILGFLGPNGAGKTTTMRILTGFMPATSGTATVAGFDVFKQSYDVRKVLGYLPENVPVYTDMRVEEYLRYRAKVKEVPRAERKNRIESAMERCFLKEVRRKLTGQLSKGFRQRVGLASCLLHNPKILILDEPTIGLDPTQIRAARSLIQSLGGEHTILLSTHILPEVEMLCKRVIIINRGRVADQGTPDELTQKMRGGNRLRAEVRGSKEKLQAALARIPSLRSVTWDDKNGVQDFTLETDPGRDVREEISTAIIGAGGVIRELHRETLTLEDIFVRITTQE
ncbi:MAG: ATP-binding cassette domain-containing protein [Planctomycetes bacterium]|nr:ATP-binding cassette domain-containing protein [Planctomycetota bacterium]